MTEAIIEDKVTEYAVALGWRPYKWTSPGKKGILDHLYFKKGCSMAIEFKRPGKKAKPLQRSEAVSLHDQGVPVICIDDIYDGKDFVYRVDQWIEANGSPYQPKLSDLRTFEP